ncbi:NAD(P)-dependent dehydrogenase (short-subunit alcohol dehydrogenase family) [Nonomuraea thailandensis]|uniref:NAD(P)-dependent dehydrogenase (Short-subunit alcohol dehydrogenase family) n=1 Tax=Nonomuraea thailandensis TaxID=1188745 RepID=A0A9X2GJV8_9ACTN|nr:SDR family NAD(P)-dependent oxidoreductase [Nonomuraea thailandensis]MCP2355893.1 NAD(P)-dependent dehydrogenase (short-subunit alcohol dehydrogenase family) [Nonomuraea thailandensis]
MSGRTAIVVGAGTGVGAAVSLALSRAGAGVVLAARPDPALTALAAGIVAAGGQAVAAPVDVGDPSAVRRLVERTLGVFGRLDIAFNQVHARALVVAMTYQIAAMRVTGGGHIVNLVPAAQDGVAELTRTVARAHAGSVVRIDAVSQAPYGSTEEVAAAVVSLCSAAGPA